MSTLLNLDDDPIAGELEGGTGRSFEALKEKELGREDEARRPFMVASELSSASRLKVKSVRLEAPGTVTWDSELPKNRNLGTCAMVDRLAASSEAKS